MGRRILFKHPKTEALILSEAFRVNPGIEVLWNEHSQGPLPDELKAQYDVEQTALAADRTQEVSRREALRNKLKAGTATTKEVQTVLSKLV